MLSKGCAGQNARDRKGSSGMKKLSVLLSILFGVGVTSGLAVDIGENISVHGFVSQGAYLTQGNNLWSETSTDGECAFTDIGLNFSSQLNDRLRVGIQLLSRTLGDDGGYEVKLDWGYLDYRLNDALGLRVGKVKLPYGLYNEYRDYDMLRTSIWLPQGVYEESLRDLMVAAQGAGIYGTLAMPVLGVFDYQAVGGTARVDSDGNYVNGYTAIATEDFMLMAQASGTADAIPVVDPSMDVKLKHIGAAAMQWHTPMSGLKFGYSLFYGKADYDLKIVPVAELDGYLERVDQVASAEYVWNNLTLAAEYMWRKDDSEDRMSGTVISENTKKGEGYYGAASYRFTDWLEIGASYSEYYPDKDDRDGDVFAMKGQETFRAWQKDFCGSVRFDVTDSLILKLEAHDINGVAQVGADLNPDGMDENWQLYAVKATVSF